MDILPVVYDPGQRRYLIDHKYLSDELGARVVHDAQTINQALGYEMNTIEFAIKDGVPYAIDFTNPAPDADAHSVGAENFAWIVDTMADVLIDRVVKPRPFELTGAWPQTTASARGHL